MNMAANRGVVSRSYALIIFVQVKMAYVDLNNSCYQRKFLLAWRRGKACCAVCVTEKQCTNIYTRIGLQQHYRIRHNKLGFSDLTVRDGVQTLRTLVANETRENLEALSEQRKKSVNTKFAPVCLKCINRFR